MSKELFKHFYKSLLAGLSIGLGGFLYCLCVFLINNELGKVLGSIAFSVGLFLVCTFYLSLYTGKIGIIYEGKQSKTFYFALPIILIGNLLAACGLGLLFYLIFKDNADFMATVNSVAESRLVLNSFYDYLSLMVRSFLCGLCVYLAVKLFALNRLKFKGTFLLVFFVFVFVYAGFQHCIANMFYFGFACSFRIETFLNLLLCVLFNSFGPVVGVMIFSLIGKKENK